MAAGVYLIHFNSPIAHARHYCGVAKDIDARFVEHITGRGARLTQVAVERGIEMKIVRTWPNEGRKFERKLKDGSLTDLCPICRDESRRRHTARQRARRQQKRAERLAQASQ